MSASPPDDSNMTFAVIPEIVRRHFDEAAFLWQLRQRASVAPDWRLSDLVDLDERLDAHLDGLGVAGPHGWKTAEAAMEEGPGELFVAGVLALEARDRARITRVIREASKSTFGQLAMATSFATVSPGCLQGIIKDLLRSTSPLGRRFGIGACVSHGVDPGNELSVLVEDPQPEVRSCAGHACGTLGLIRYRSVLSELAAVDSEDQRLEAAIAAVLLGDRGLSLDVLTHVDTTDPEQRARAFRLATQALPKTELRQILHNLSRDSTQRRRLLEMTGIAGDVAYVPWHIKEMGDNNAARVAAEAFSVVTGVDLRERALEAPRPEGFESRPNDDPNDPNVDMDPDEGLPWPDVHKIEDWWAENSHRFREGTRYFMGQPLTREHCIHVLKTGYQRQRILAAHYLCLLDPGTPLFNTSAPAWRQQRLLAQM